MEITAPPRFAMRLLGPFDIRCEGNRLPPLRTHKGEWLLALLALRYGRSVSREWLAGTLWPDSIDVRALYNLRRSLSDLRHALGNEAWRLQSPTARNVALDLTEAEVDIVRFDRLIEAGGIADLEAAVRLYGGPLLEGCDEAWAVQERSHREEGYLMALEKLAASAATTGDSASGIAYLRQIVSREPTRETAQCALMTALARSGDHAAVLLVYRELRQRLRDQLNTDPSPETQALFRQLRDRSAATGLPVPQETSLAFSAGAPLPPTPPPAIPATDTPVDAATLTLEPIGGAVPLESPFYIERPTDTTFRQALLRRDSIVLVKGPRQVGKTSLVSRGLQAARRAGARVVVTDLQKLLPRDLISTDTLFLTLARHLADRLDLETAPEAVWREHAGPNENLERYLRRYVLARGKADGEDGSLIWGIDEVDRLFAHPCGSEVFALFRSWHNERALDPDGPWSRLTLAIAYATEAHLFITDLNQSPFNVGTRLTVSDFTPEQVSELTRRHGQALQDTPGVTARLFALFGGHPYLIRRALYELTIGGMTLDSLEATAARREGVFGDHLQRLVALVEQDPAMGASVREVLRGRPCPSGDSFYRLRTAGVIVGDAPDEARLRCGLYADYLSRHLE